MLAGCGSSPQVLEISPQRAATEVRSAEPVRIRFDRAMDRASVAAHFHLEPSSPGALRWSSDREVLFDHAPLRPSALYTVVLSPGYRDAQGNANSLRHSWWFRTEAPPTFDGSSPGSGDQNVDPATYITLTFSREMDPTALHGAISLSPSVPFAIRQDALDPRRVILAPESLLEPAMAYTVTVTEDARDVDGNRLDAGGVDSFTTGASRPLRRWIGFIAETTPGTGGDGMWIVDENRFPRRLVSTPVDAFFWSPDGGHVLVRGPTGSWSDQALGGTITPLPFRGEWAGFLAPGRGYAFLEGGDLAIFRPDGQVTEVASGVSQAAIAPGGSRLAFVVGGPPGVEIDAYDAGLRARFRLLAEPAPIDGLAWSPDGLGLAYRVDAADPARRQVRALLLKDGGTATVATGDVSTPAWQADSRHVFLTSIVASPAGPVAKVFRLGVGDPPPKTLAAAAGMPATPVPEILSLSPSADGHQLAFVADRAGVDGGQSVWLMNADGTGLTQLTEYDPARFPYSCRGVAWTPG